ncbi:MAG: class I SAM-dependent methyltransferase [Candidatus Nealsonbacteria bacterium]|nr:class I SAM-dependent methyltransferase [Candidatus Nealsonbacteria bacterium]
MEGFLDPTKILKEMRLRRNMTAIDFGCGSGGWAIPLAKELEEGKVIAIDILEEPLSALKARAKLEKILNIEMVLADAEKGTDIFENSADLVLMTNLLFQCEDRKKVMEEGKRVLKSSGRILIIDWSLDSPIGPKEGRVSPEDVKTLAQDIGLKNKKEFKASPYHYGLIFEK